MPGTTDGFRLLGSNDLGGRGLNSPLAVAGDCAYVGDRDFSGSLRENAGVAIVDVSRVEQGELPQVGRIPAVQGVTQRELRADRDLGLLLVMTYATTGATKGNALEVYDIAADCAKPVKLSTFDFGVRPPHEFFWWKDPVNPGRSLAYVTTTLFAPDLSVVDLTDPRSPSLRTTYDLLVDQADDVQDAPASGSGYLHSLSVSDDGSRAYMGTWDYGTYVADTSQVSDPSVAVPLVLPVGLGRLDYGGNVHGTVKLPGRPYGVMVEEAYANAGKGCPFGWLRTVDLTDEANPVLGGEFTVPENDCETSTAANGTFSAHNQTTFPNLTLLTWYAGGLRAVDVEDPLAPVEAGVFVPEGTVEPSTERDERLFFAGSTRPKRAGAMWSYPVVQDGVVYAVDIDLGLFALRYTGRHADEVARAASVEGNASPARYTRSAPRLTRPASLATPRLTAPRVVRDLTPVAPGTARRTWDFTC